MTISELIHLIKKILELFLAHYQSWHIGIICCSFYKLVFFIGELHRYTENHYTLRAPVIQGGTRTPKVYLPPIDERSKGSAKI